MTRTQHATAFLERMGLGCLAGLAVVYPLWMAGERTAALIGDAIFAGLFMLTGLWWIAQVLRGDEPDHDAFKLTDNEIGRTKGDRICTPRLEIGQVTITHVGDPRGEWPEVTHVRYSFTGELTEEAILAVLQEIDDDTAGSSRIFDSAAKTGGYALVDANSRVKVGQVIPIHAAALDPLEARSEYASFRLTDDELNRILHVKET